jgi:hypothetical protein
VPDGRRIKAHLKAEKGLLSKPHLLLKQVSEVRDKPHSSPQAVARAL